MEKQHEVQHRGILTAGVDWLTCSLSKGVVGSEFDRLGRELVAEGKRTGARTRLATWQGYAGMRGENFFYGWHGDKAVVTLSGPHEPSLVQQFITAASNVSRIDLQLTVESLPAEPALGRINYRQLCDYDGRPGMKPIVTTIQNTRHGHTNAVGSRISDAYGRNYDKGIEGKLCEPGRLWRYEVEFKRGRAKAVADQIAQSKNIMTDSARTVHQWWSSRGVQPTPREPRGYLIDTRLPARAEADYLTYFERNVSSSVRKAVDAHGLHAVLRSLGLLNLVGDSYTRKES